MSYSHDDGHQAILPAPLSWDDLWVKGRSPVPILAAPLLPEKRIVTLYGPAKAGKSRLALQMGAAIATGSTFLGQPTIQRKVMYLDFENDPVADVQPRLAAMGYRPRDLEDNLLYFAFPIFDPLDGSEGGEQVLDLVHQYDGQVLILDTVGRVVRGEENSNDTWKRFYSCTLMPLRRAGATVLLLDHCGKDASKGLRGGSSKNGDVDAVWGLAPRRNGRRVLNQDLCRFGAPRAEIVLDERFMPIEGASRFAAESRIEETIAGIIEMADAAGLPNNASIQRVKDVMKECCVKGSTEAVQEAVRTRKNRS